MSEQAKRTEEVQVLIDEIREETCSEDDEGVPFYDAGLADNIIRKWASAALQEAERRGVEKGRREGRDSGIAELRAALLEKSRPETKAVHGFVLLSDVINTLIAPESMSKKYICQNCGSDVPISQVYTGSYPGTSGEWKDWHYLPGHVACGPIEEVAVVKEGAVLKKKYQLKPCPFCGGKIGVPENPDKLFTNLKCTGCGMEFAPCQETFADELELMNRRAPDPRVAALVKAGKALRDSCKYCERMGVHSGRECAEWDAALVALEGEGR